MYLYVKQLFIGIIFVTEKQWHKHNLGRRKWQETCIIYKIILLLRLEKKKRTRLLSYLKIYNLKFY